MPTILRTCRLIPTLVLWGACTPMSSESPPADLVLRVAPATVEPGDSVTLVLVNESSGAIGYNLCTSALQRQSGGEWQRVASERVCTLELRTLEPGNEDDYTLTLPEDLAAGEYRFITSIERMATGDRVGLTSEPIQVGG